MMYSIYFKEGGRTKFAAPIRSKSEFIELRSDATHLENVEKARSGDSTAKRHCLNVMIQGHPNDDGSLKGTKRLASHVFFDIDDKEEAQRVAELLMQNPEEHSVGMIDKSINGGLHLAVRRDYGKTILECQCELALKLHCEMDLNNKDASRMCFCAGPDDLLYINDEMFIDDFNSEEWERERAVMAGRKEDLPEGAHSNDKHFRPWEHNWPSHGIVVGNQAPTVETTNVCPSSSGTQCYPTNYEGIPYSQIIQTYWKIYNNGNEPTEGNRNTLTYELVSNMAPLCDYNKSWLEEIIPRYDNFPEEEWHQTISSALCQPRKGMPYRTRMVLKEFQATQKMRAFGDNVNHPPHMNFRLTGFLKTLCKNTPKVYWPTVCEAAFPALGAHTHGVSVKFIDGVEHEFAFLSVLIKDMSAGKGCINKPIEYIMADIAETDRKNRAREAEYKRKNPSGKKKQERPDDIYIQMLMSDMTSAAFNQRLFDCDRNGGRTLYTKVDELELLKQLENKRTSVISLTKIAWDRASTGAERVGAESVDGNAPCRWNFNASTTPSRGRRMIGPYVNDGTLSRLMLNTIDLPDDFDEIPVYKTYDESYAEALRPYIERLNNARGLIRCKQAEDLARQMDHENKELASVLDSKAYLTLSFRTNANAFKKGMLLYIINGMKWSKDIEAYVRWSFQWDMWTKFRYFGDLMEKAIKDDELAVNPGPQNHLSLLPDPFSATDYQRRGIKDATVRKWKSRGYIDYDDTMNLYVKRGKFACDNTRVTMTV